MKKTVFLLTTGLFFTIAAMAQTGATATTSTTTQNPAVKSGMKDMRHDVRELRKDKRQRDEALENGNKAKANALGKDIRSDKKDINHDRKQLQSEGVKHPIKRADRQIHRQNMEHKG
ncbi:MAG: hypothetical protein EKK39_12375 [Sphingobacteriales bacterium]|uniref:hypothetical protein n=1 Tax=Hydrotalea flava TaxID=714549 RepID=UPI000FC2CFE7|nr:hypothetical protein [Hydrotalea flava]RTL48557.1 MAG: hypothetical protein EKK39_12375 [Sphingobacteriales bacterium]